MRKLLKMILPPFVGFALFFIAVRYSSQYFNLTIDEIGEGTVNSFMAYYRYFLPLLFVVGVLTQLLIIVPLWTKVITKSTASKITSFIVLCFICLLFATGLAYCMWEKQSGLYHFIRLCLFMTGVQIAYWLLNIIILFLLTAKPKPEASVKKTNTTE
jgi:hypothetical protein